MPMRLIDTQISQNASSTGALSITIGTTPQLFGTLGLNTAAAGPNIQVHIQATVTLSGTLTILTPVNITVFRVQDGVSFPIYSATETLAVGGLLGLTTQVLTVNAVDYQPPNTGFIVYQAFVSVPNPLITVFPTRVGPECMFAEAYSD